MFDQTVATVILVFTGAIILVFGPLSLFCLHQQIKSEDPSLPLL
jgi:hypothetical protein